VYITFIYSFIHILLIDGVNDMHIGTRYVILAKHWMWLPDDGFTWNETCWSSFYNL